MGVLRLKMVTAFGIVYGVGWFLVDVVCLLAYPYCDHPTKCFDYEKELAASVDPTVDPCDNLYEHVCGNWDRLYPTRGKQRGGQFGVLQSRVYVFALNELEQTPPEHPVKAVRRSVSAYQSCLNVFAEKTDHTNVVFDIFRKFNFEWPSLALSKKFDLMEYLLGMPLEYNLATPAQLALAPHLKTNKRYSLYFRINEEFEGTRDMETIAKCITAVAPSVKGYSAMALAGRILTFLVHLKTTAFALSGEYLYYTIEQLANETGGPSMIDTWLKVINNHLPHDRAVGKTEDVLTRTDSALLLKEILANAKRSRYADIVLYAGWQIVVGLRAAASPSLVECVAGNDLHAQLDSGLECLKSVNEVAQFAFVRWIVDSLELQPNANATKDTWSALKLGTRENFAKLPWMDQSTVKIAGEHVDSILGIFALPEHLQTNEALEASYGYLPEPDESQPFIRWLIKTQHQRLEEQKRLLKEDPTVSIHRDDFPYDAFKVNAFYYHLYHLVAALPAIMAPPLVSQSVPAAVNYGAIGTILGHELSHAFDLSLIPYGSTGENTPEWSLVAVFSFLNRLGCVVRQLENYTADIAHSFNAASETFADTAGTEKARLAFASLPAKKGILGYTQEQSFFIAGCFQFCSEGAYAWDQYGKYPAKVLRCNLPAGNEKRFAAAFSCPSEVALNPKNRCTFHSIERYKLPSNMNLGATESIPNYQ
ncbi:endothelin-converting enzyme homolog [Dermacentor silvarum]|uniref:endothelin-converting enzyme homolog n=1 Tax=Dermacentor silvarum TaxID=543639 RepID=UPI001896EBDC|nr:endothelin-converting enzyme homolog [Dermacentor silvarum]